MARSERPSRRALPVSGARLRAPSVLVVDDIADNREMYIEYLRFSGFRVTGAEDGASALEAARTDRPAVILMDMSLPGLDGWEATRILKGDPETQHIHIIAVTGHADPASRARALSLGCDLFLAKPTLPEEIVAHIFRLLDGAAEKASSR